MENKDQAKGHPAPEQSRQASFDEAFNKGWDQVELLTQQEHAAKESPQKTPAEKTPGTDEGEKSTSDRTPFKVLKVQGKELPVYSEDELIELAQKGADYTKKTQTLAEDRKQAEAQIRDEERRLNDEAKKLNDTLDELMRLKAQKPPEKDPFATDEEGMDGISPEDAKIYKDYGIDPKFAQPHEVKLAKDLADVKSMIQEIKTERADKQIREIISKERETYPYDDIVDDQGQNITEKQLAAIVTARRELATKNKENPDPARWLKDAVQEVHLSQKKTRETLSITNDTDPDSFESRFPELAAKLKDKYSSQATERRAAVPPALPPTRREPGVPAKRAVSPKGKSLNDWLDEGFEDPDVLKALQGGG